MSIKSTELRQYIIRPSLQAIGYYSEVAEELLIATCAHESESGFYLKQVNGPALGIYQMEPATYHDCIANFLNYNLELRNKILDFLDIKDFPSESFLIGNLYLSTIMCRIKYLRVKEALPLNRDDVYGLAHYWKNYYNTQDGKGSVEDFVKNYTDYVK